MVIFLKSFYMNSLIYVRSILFKIKFQFVLLKSDTTCCAITNSTFENYKRWRRRLVIKKSVREAHSRKRDSSLKYKLNSICAAYKILAKS